MRGRGLAFLAGRATAKSRQSQAVHSSENGQTAQLEKLKKLHDDGSLTDEEFAQAKKKVLSGT